MIGGNKMKKILSIFISLLLIATCFVGCGKNEKGKVYYLNFKPEQDAAWQSLAKKYTAETGVYDMKAEEFYEAESGVMIYYVEALEDATDVLIPKDCVYTVSGNNVDGFIITCTK